VSELKPCPFCGGEAETQEWKKMGETAMQYGHIICPRCSVYFGWADIRTDRTYDTAREEKAIASWNTRTADKRIQELDKKFCDQWNDRDAAESKLWKAQERIAALSEDNALNVTRMNAMIAKLTELGVGLDELAEGKKDFQNRLRENTKHHPID